MSLDQELTDFKLLGFELWAGGVDKATITLSYMKGDWPIGRSLILRGFTQDPAYAQLNTDKRSLKVEALTDYPKVCLLVWDRGKGLQSQLWGEVAVIVDQQDPVWKAAWQAVKPHSMEAYARPIAPGSVKANRRVFDLPDDDLTEVAKANFAVLSIKLLSMELVDLRQGDHRRAVFEFENGLGQWICP